MFQKFGLRYQICLIALLCSCGSTPKLQTNEAWDTTYDESRKMAMSPDELQWELTLEKNLSENELVVYKNKKHNKDETAFDYVSENSQLPRVLLIGDAQSIAYTTKVRKKLKGIANVIRIPENAKNSTYAAERINYWINTTTPNKKWDLIHFQIGSGDRETPLYNYAQNIRQIVRVLKRTKAKLVWSNLTPSKPRDLSIKLNEISGRTMAAHKIPVVDLYNAELPFINDDQKIGENLNDDGLETVASQIAKVIKKELSK